MEEYIKIATEFSATPGARYISDGKHSGQEFYETLLKDRYETAMKNGRKLTVDLDGTHGYATSFLDEAFGRLSKDFGAVNVFNNIFFVSNEEPYLIDEIKDYINEANNIN
jgi:phosphomannomutase